MPLKKNHLLQEQFYDELSDNIQTYSNNYLVVMGDFNAQVGTCQKGEEKVLGKFGYGKRSPRGQLLVEFLLEHNLSLLNSQYKKNAKVKWTWISPDGTYKNEIDYIITNSPKNFTNTEVIQNLNFYTNHRMVRGSIRPNPSKVSRKNITGNNRTQLIGEEEINATKTLLREYKEHSTNNIEISKKYDNLEKKLTCRVDNKRSKTNYLSKYSIQLLEARKALLSQSNKKQRAKEIVEISKNIRKSFRKYRKLKRLQTVEKHVIKTGSIKRALKEVREVDREWIPRMKKRDKIITKRKDIEEHASEFYQQLYSTKANETSDNSISHQLSLDTEIEPTIISSEVDKAIISEKLQKAPGPDGIANELLRSTIEEISPVLKNIFNEILTTGYIPPQWTNSNIILLHKKGPKGDIGNYRPISLISNVYKVFAKVVLNRISCKLDEQQPTEQAGFQKTTLH